MSSALFDRAVPRTGSTHRVVQETVGHGFPAIGWARPMRTLYAGRAKGTPYVSQTPTAVWSALSVPGVQSTEVDLVHHLVAKDRGQVGGVPQIPSVERSGDRLLRPAQIGADRTGTGQVLTGDPAQWTGPDDQHPAWLRRLGTDVGEDSETDQDMKGEGDQQQAAHLRRGNAEEPSSHRDDRDNR